MLFSKLQMNLLIQKCRPIKANDDKTFLRKKNRGILFKNHQEIPTKNESYQWSALQ